MLPSARKEVATVVLLTMLLAGATWQRSGDPFIDWGRELYSAMSVAGGFGIPEDVQLLFGSLSPLVNGAILYVAGEQVASILVMNLAILAATCALIWWIAVRVFGLSAAFMTTLVWLLLCAFPHLVRVGNYNYLTPYAHGTTHGLTLGLLCTACVLQALRRTSVAWWMGAGLACGFTIFAKPEAGLASVATLIAGSILGQAIGKNRFDRKLLASLAGLGVACVTVVPVAWLAGGVSPLAHLYPYRSAIRALTMDLPYYAGGSFGHSALATFLIGGTLFFAIAAVALFAESRDLRTDEAPPVNSLSSRWRAASVAIPVVAVTVSAAVAPFAWHRLATVLPWVCGAALISGLHTASAKDASVDDDTKFSAAARTILAVFATAWLLKIVGAPRFDHYGFALAAPALFLAIGLLTGDRTLGRSRSPGSLVRRKAVGSALALYLVISAASQSAAFYSKRTTAIGAAGNRIYLLQPAFDPRTGVFQELLRELDASAGFRAGAIILPEGGLFHFLLEEPSAIRVASLMPLEVLMLGSSHVVNLISHSEPDLILITDPGLEKWSSARSTALRPYSELLEAIESNCILEHESGARTTSTDRIRLRFFSPCPGFAGDSSSDARSRRSSPKPGSVAS